MKKRILYSILNEWRDEDMDDFPLDLDDMDFDVTSSNMSDEPDLGDDEFTLSKIHSQYEYFPETKDELKEIVKMEIEKQGGVDVNLNMINTSKITDMFGIFWGHESLRSLDISKWNVSKVKCMNCMFYGCESLKTLDVSRWNVSSVEVMFSMFRKCQSLETLDVSRWDVSSVEDFSNMFSDCKSLETLDVSRWKLSSVKNMRFMFAGCKSLHTDTRMWNINAKHTGEIIYYNAPNIKHN